MEWIYKMKTVAVIGLGLIGSSICRSLKRNGLYTVVGFDNNPQYNEISNQLGFCHRIADTVNTAVIDADIIVLATPVSYYGEIVKTIINDLKSGAIITDVGSVKTAVISSITPHLTDGILFVPAHPIAGTEKSGPNAGFDSLFENRFCIVCPSDFSTDDAVDTIRQMWQSMGSTVDIMDAQHHDKTLAITSHIPHLLAYTLVGTAQKLQGDLNEDNITKNEVIKYSAGGFRDATRVAGSDPTMWRDIFLTNKDSIREIINLFENDLHRLQQAMDEQDGEFLYNWCNRTRQIRQGVIDAGQEKMIDLSDNDFIPLTPYNND